jgi:lysophospholipase L1-like esterase
MYDPPAITRPPARATIVILGLFAATAAALLALLTLGEAAAIATVFVVVGGAALAAWRSGPRAGRFAVAALSVVLVGSIGVIGYGAYQLLIAFGGTGSSQPVAAADPIALATADEKISSSEGDSAFRLELSESELNALLQDALGAIRTPFRAVTIDILNATGEPGRIGFVGEFKNGSLDIDGVLSAEVVSGSLELTIIEAGAGIFAMPGVAREAVEDMISSVTDLERALTAEGADVQDIVIGNEQVVVTGINRTETVIDSMAVLAGLEGQIAPTSLDSVDIPGFPPGRVAVVADGPRYYLALGDSLGAAVGVDEPREGYVSRFHAWLEATGSTVLGLRNFSGAGETSGTLLAGEQLSRFEAFAAANDVQLVTIDIGANDLLGHLGSSDCTETTSSEACEQRIDSAIDAYGRNLTEILDRLGSAAPGATIIFLTTYNPFSFGFEDAVEFERLSNEAVARLNAVAINLAAERDILVADGFSPMRGTTTLTTRMLDLAPDIHPNELGYDILTAAIVDAVS